MRASKVVGSVPVEAFTVVNGAERSTHLIVLLPDTPPQPSRRTEYPACCDHGKELIGECDACAKWVVGARIMDGSVYQLAWSHTVEVLDDGPESS